MLSVDARRHVLVSLYLGADVGRIHLMDMVANADDVPEAEGLAGRDMVDAVLRQVDGMKRAIASLMARTLNVSEPPHEGMLAEGQVLADWMEEGRQRFRDIGGRADGGEGMPYLVRLFLDMEAVDAEMIPDGVPSRLCDVVVDASSEAGACAVVRRALSGKRLAPAVLGILVGEVSASAVGMRAIAVDDFVRALVDEYWRPLVEDG